MSENKNIDELIELAKQTEASLLKQREEEAIAERDKAAANDTEQLYKDREDQLERHQEMARLKQEKEALPEKMKQLSGRHEALVLSRQEVEAKIADDKIPQPARDLYQQALEQIKKEQADLEAEMANIQKQSDFIDAANQEHLDFINRTNKEADALLVDRKAKIDEVLKYIRRQREIREQEPLMDKIVEAVNEKLFKKLENSPHLGQVTLELGVDDSVDEIESAPEITKPLSKIFADQELLKLFKFKLEESFGKRYQELSQEGKVKKDDRQYLYRGEIFIRLWGTNGDMGNACFFRMTESPDQASRVDFKFEEMSSFSEEEQQKIKLAIEDENYSEDALRVELDTYNEGVAGRIQGDANKENDQRERQKEIEKEKARIRFLEKKIEESNLELSKLSIAERFRNLQKRIDEFTRDINRKNDHIHSVELDKRRWTKELEEVERYKTIFGRVRDKQRQSTLQQKIQDAPLEALVAERDSFQKKIDELSEKRKAIEVELKEKGVYTDHFPPDINYAIQVVQADIREKQKWIEDSLKTITELEKKQ